MTRLFVHADVDVHENLKSFMNKFDITFNVCAQKKDKEARGIDREGIHQLMLDMIHIPGMMHFLHTGRFAKVVDASPDQAWNHLVKTLHGVFHKNIEYFSDCSQAIFKMLIK